MQKIIIFITWMSFIASATAILCYDCDSMSDPHCSEHFNPDGVMQSACDGSIMPLYLAKYKEIVPSTGCITRIYEGEDGGRNYIVRGCYFGDLKNTDEACEASDPDEPYTEILDCRVCTTDLCNTNDGNRLEVALATLLMVLVAYCF